MLEQHRVGPLGEGRDIEALPFSYAVGWLLMLLYELPMLVRFLRSSEM